MKLYTQLPSQSFSTGQTLLHPAPIILDWKIVWADPLILSVVICLINFGISMLVGQLFVQGAS